jgi:hypothetical protein
VARGDSSADRRILAQVRFPAALALALLPTAPALAQEDVDVVIARDEAALGALVAPEGGTATICDGSTCPAGITRILADEIHFGARGSRATVSARLRVTALVPLIGPTQLQSNVRCEGEPRIDGAGILRVHGVACQVGELPGVSEAVGASVARSLEARSLDVGQRVRDGMLSAHSSDPRLASPCASRCVQRVALATPLERGGRLEVALRVRLRPRGQCCP